MRRAGSTRASAPTLTSSIGQKAVPAKWSEPPSGKIAAMPTPPTSDGPPSATAVRQSGPWPERISSRARAPARTAMAATSRNTPATGLAHTAPSESAAAAARERRAHAHTATAKAIPSVKGMRPITTLESIPPRNIQAAIAAVVGVGAIRRASAANTATATTAATTPTTRVPATAASGG